MATTPEVTRSRRRRRRPRVLPMLGAVRLLAARTARRDGALLGAWFVVVALAVGVAVGGPRLATQVLDVAAREAVAQAGHDADLVATLRGSRVDRALRYADDAVGEIDLPAVRGVVDDAVVTLGGAGVEVISVTRGAGGTAVAPEAELFVRPALLSMPGKPEPLVRVVSGDLPADEEPAEGAPVPVAVPVSAAAARDLQLGDVLELPSLRASLTSTPPTALVVVVALVEPLDEDDLAWMDAGPLWTYQRGDAVPVLATPLAVSALDQAVGGHWYAVVRLLVDADRFDASVATRAGAELDVLQIGVEGVLPTTVQRGASISSALPEVLDGFAHEARSAAAQMSVPTVGAAGTVALVLVLLARLVVERRRSVLELERARGAAVGTVVLRLGVEALVVTGAAAAVALATLTWLLPGATGGVGLVAVLAAAVLASPVWGGLLARRAWSGSRVPANRRDRVRQARRRASARVVGEVSMLVVAAAAAVALRRRGLLQTATLDADPFLGAAPLLVALAAAVLTLRLYPWPVLAAGVLARRSPGALGVVGASRARRALQPLPLLVLTLAVAVGVGGLLLVSTIRSGQVRASWDLVAADASLTADDVRPLAARMQDAPGVTTVSTARVVAGARADLGNREETVTVLAVDDAYLGTQADLPGAGHDLDALADLPYGMTVPVPERGAERPTVQAVVGPELADRIGTRGLSIWVAGTRTELDIVGTTDHAPRGSGPGPFVFLALGTLVAEDGPLTPTVAWVHGPGAGDAVRTAVDGLPPESAVAMVQVDWLADHRSASLVGGVERTLLTGAGVAALLAAVGVAGTAVAGSGERGRTLALLRTLGMRPRLGWWLALVELAPVVAAATAAGALAGVTIVHVLGAALGLDVLVGGPEVPGVVVDPATLAWVTGAAVGLLLVAVAVDVLAHRRDRLADVLRVGEAPGR